MQRPSSSFISIRSNGCHLNLGVAIDSKPQQLKENRGVSDVARAAGVSVSTASQKLRRGKTTEQIIQEAKDWKEKQQQQASRTAGRRTAKDGDESYFEAQRRKEIALANLRELELAIKSGELVPVAEINAWVAGNIVEARNILIRIAPELRDRLAIESDPAETDKLISVEIDRALAVLEEFPRP
jgi:hypothetical protein